VGQGSGKRANRCLGWIIYNGGGQETIEKTPCLLGTGSRWSDIQTLEVIGPGG